MGIKSINTLLKRQSPEAFFSMPIEEIRGKRIAIDGNNWMYTNMATARKRVINRTDIATQEPNPVEIRKEWFLLAINFVVGWLSYNVTPVFVFDGKHPVEKEETKEKRKAVRTNAKAKIEALYAQLNGDILDRPANIVDELRKELRNYNCISSEDFELFKIVMKGIGVPCLQAEGDGEKLCSSLCIEEKVAATFSVDTDNLVYGCPLVVTNFSDSSTYDEFGNRISNLDCVRFDKVLEGIKMTHAQFVDLCIMSGCDYNTNMPGYASVKSFVLLQKHGCIENLPPQLNKDCLKYERCRQLFEYTPSDLLTKDDLILDIDKTAIINARDYLEMAGVSGQISRIIAAYNTASSSDGLIESLKLSIGPKYTPSETFVITPQNVPRKRVVLNIIDD